MNYINRDTDMWKLYHLGDDCLQLSVTPQSGSEYFLYRSLGLVSKSRRKKLTKGLSFNYFDQYKILLPQGWEWALDVRGADTAVILRNICQYTSSYISHKYLSTELCHPQTSGLSWISQSDLKSLYWITRLCLHIILYKKEKIYIKKQDRQKYIIFRQIPSMLLHDVSCC